MNIIKNNTPTNNNSINYCILLLNTFKDVLNNIQKEIMQLTENNQTLFNKLKESFYEIIKEIDNNLIILKNFEQYNTKFNVNIKEKIFKDLEKKYDIFNLNIKNIYDNENIKEIRKLVDELKNKLLNLFDYSFEPPNINSFFSSKDFFQDISDKIYESNISLVSEINKESNKKENNSIIKCSICNNNEAKFICRKCDFFSCENCRNNHKKNSFHKVEMIDTIKLEKEINKNLFLKSAQDSIIYILLMINSLLNYEKMETINDKGYISKIYIKREIKYPYSDIKDSDSCLSFLKEIFTKIMEFNIPPFNIKEFYISGMNKDLIGMIKNIIKDDKINLYKDNLDIIENNFFSDDDYFSDE